MKTHKHLGFAIVILGALSAAQSSRGDFFQQTNLSSDVPGLAPNTDPNLKNPWGMSFGTATPFWASDQVTGRTTLLDGTGKTLATFAIPTKGGAGPQGPTGQVFNSTPDFALTTGGKALFLFANLDGTISGWNPSLGGSAEIHVVPTSPAVYTGLALGNDGSGNFLYAADARGKIDVFNGSFAKVSLGGDFTGATVPAGLTPYNIQNIGGTLYVTYASLTQHGGAVAAFDLDGHFLREIASNGPGGILDMPWGLTIAPAGFGRFGGDLLVGNKGDGHISAFDPITGAFKGQLLDQSGNPLANTGLWALDFRTAGPKIDPNTLYFVAGINSEQNGLFGAITAVPEPSSFVLIGLGGLALAASRLRRKTRAV